MIRAGLVTAVAAGVKGGLVDDHIAYVTSDEAFRTPFARGFRVVETLPYREKALRAALRERNIGSLTIKKRGVDVVPDELRKRLSLAGDEAGDHRAHPRPRARDCPAGRVVLRFSIRVGAARAPRPAAAPALQRDPAAPRPEHASRRACRRTSRS